jgi:dTMP kinase
MKKKKGQLIVLEGNDGSGKTTQLKLLLHYLKNEKISYHSFDFPQYQRTFFGRFIGKFLRGELGDPGKLNPYLISLPFAADRWQAKEMINKALCTKKIVLCNRYASSNLAYQVSRAEPKLRYGLYRWLNALEYKQLAIAKEDVVLFLYVPYTISMELIKLKKERQYLRGRKLDIYESNPDLLKKVDETYLWLLQKNSHWHRIDCVSNKQMLSKEQIHKKIITKLKELKVI